MQKEEEEAFHQQNGLRF